MCGHTHLLSSSLPVELLCLSAGHFHPDLSYSLARGPRLLLVGADPGAHRSRVSPEQHQRALYRDGDPSGPEGKSYCPSSLPLPTFPAAVGCVLGTGRAARRGAARVRACVRARADERTDVRKWTTINQRARPTAPNRVCLPLVTQIAHVGGAHECRQREKRAVRLQVSQKRLARGFILKCCSPLPFLISHCHISLLGFVIK